jgi:hypothetical protein
MFMKGNALQLFGGERLFSVRTPIAEMAGRKGKARLSLGERSRKEIVAPTLRSACANLKAGWRRTSPVLRFTADQARRSMVKTDWSFR